MAETIIDLDVLAPPSVTVKVDGQIVTVPPIKIIDLVRLGVLSRKMFGSDTMTTDELNQAVAALTEQVYVCIPELRGKDLSLRQLQKLIEILNEMGVPPDETTKDGKKVEVTSPKVPE